MLKQYQLVTGDVIVANSTEDPFVLDVPMHVYPTPRQDGTVEITLIPYGYPIVQHDPIKGYQVRFTSNAFLTEPVEAPTHLQEAHRRLTSRIQTPNGLNIVKP